MKKYWKVRAEDFKQSLEKIGVNSNYINILIDPVNDPMKYLKNSKYIYISYNSHSHCSFGWEKIENVDFYINNNYEFAGTINLRKQKLDKLNELH